VWLFRCEACGPFVGTLCAWHGLWINYWRAPGLARWDDVRLSEFGAGAGLAAHPDSRRLWHSTGPGGVSVPGAALLWVSRQDRLNALWVVFVMAVSGSPGLVMFTYYEYLRSLFSRACRASTE